MEEFKTIPPLNCKISRIKFGELLTYLSTHDDIHKITISRTKPNYPSDPENSVAIWVYTEIKRFDPSVIFRQFNVHVPLGQNIIVDKPTKRNLNIYEPGVDEYDYALEFFCMHIEIID